jgi:hypothetical protein
MFVISIDNTYIVSVLTDINDVDFNYKMLMDEYKSSFQLTTEYRSVDNRVILYIPQSKEVICSDNYITHICNGRDYKKVECDINLAIAKELLKIYYKITTNEGITIDLNDKIPHSAIYHFMGCMAMYNINIGVPDVESIPPNASKYGYIKGPATTVVPFINIVLIIMKNPAIFDQKVMMKDSVNIKTKHEDGIFYHNTSVDEHKSEISKHTM